MSYSNFKDPIGLIRRLLGSKNKTAYFVLLREALAILLMPIDFLLQVFERKVLKKSTQSSLPLVLILGGSRNGTTLLYQTLVQYLPVSYFSNFTASFSRSPITAFRFFGKFLPRPKGNFRSYFGSVSGFGGPSDAFQIWNKWLGRDRNYAPSKISKRKQLAMKNFFQAWHGVAKMPLLNKNNRNSLCVPLLNGIFENIYFIEIRRDPIYVAQSLILSRLAIQGDKKTGWGLLSKDTDTNDEKFAYIDDVCRQVYEVDKMLDEARKNVESTRYMRIAFETFCRDPEKTVQDISHFVLKQNCDQDLATLALSQDTNQKKLSDEEFARIVKCIRGLYGKFTSNDTIVANDI